MLCVGVHCLLCEPRYIFARKATDVYDESTIVGQRRSASISQRTRGSNRKGRCRSVECALGRDLGFASLN